MSVVFVVLCSVRQYFAHKHHRKPWVWVRNRWESPVGYRRWLIQRPPPPPITGLQFKAKVLSTFGHWGEGDLYRAIPSVTRALGFCGLNQRTAPNLVYIGTEVKLYITIYCKRITFGDVFFLAPLAVESFRQIKYTAKCTFMKVWISGYKSTSKSNPL